MNKRRYLVKKILILYMLFLFSCFLSCNEIETIPREAETRILEKLVKKKKLQKTVFMTGEHDRFHPRSPVESIRKQKLTNMGILKKKPPILTPDSESAEKALNPPDTGYYKAYAYFTDSIPPEIPSYPFDYENDIQALKRLYLQHNLDEIIKEEMSELDKMLALMVYTNEFLTGGKPPSPDMRWKLGPSAETITQFRREKNIGGTSEQYAALFCQLSLSCGFNSRIISMHTLADDGEPLTHNICEVYLNTFDKWIVFDPYSRATYYLREEIPLSALELRNLMFENYFRIITPVSGIGDFSDIVSVREEILPRYRYIYMWRMNDILGRSLSGKSVPWQALYQVHLVWEDDKAIIAEGGFEKLDKFNNLENPAYPLKGVKYVTRDEDDFYWILNHVMVHVGRESINNIRLYLDTITPNFDFFEITVSDRNLLYKLPNNEIVLEDCFSDITIKSFNSFGISGSKTTVLLRR